jgi:hypothetical protein
MTHVVDVVRLDADRVVIGLAHHFLAKVSVADNGVNIVTG